jgi:hypothetical protein
MLVLVQLIINILVMGQLILDMEMVNRMVQLIKDMAGINPKKVLAQVNVLV